jgi:D-glycero-D-manno-heptose 1,7-bisphosphate phosphatase
MKLENVGQACILVGGKGTRLGELTRTVPKPLMEIADKTVFLDIVVGHLVRQGFTDIVLLAGYLGDAVRARYDRRSAGSARLRVIVEPEPRGTAGALVAARDVLAQRFVLLNGDSFFDIDLQALCAGHAAAGREALIALRHVPDGSRYGSVTLEGDRIERFIEKSKTTGPALINAGIYLLQADIVDRVHTLPCSIETDIFPLLAEERRLYGRICEGYFIDIGLPETLQQARRELTALARAAVVTRL